MNHSGPGNFPISLPINSRPGNDVKNPDNNQEPVLSAYGGGTFAKKNSNSLRDRPVRIP